MNDNKWHTVSVARPGQKRHTLLIDEEFLAQAEVKVPKYQPASGGLAGLVHIENEEDLHLDLDGILFLGKFEVIVITHHCKEKVAIPPVPTARGLCVGPRNCGKRKGNKRSLSVLN